MTEPNYRGSAAVTAVLLQGALLLAGCRGSAPPSRSADQRAVPQFTEITSEAGIDFEHHHCGIGHRYFPETSCGGAVLFDCDGDDDLDLYCVQGAPVPGYQGPDPGGNALYLNDGTGHFARAPDSGAEDRGYGIGAIAADYDNDGDQDLYVVNYGPNALLRNEGDARFVDVTEQAGVSGGDVFSSDATFGDYDRDGHLDLFVANYVVYEWGHEDKIRVPGQVMAYFGPRAFRGQPNALYRGNGDGTFTDVTRTAGLHNEIGKGMDAAWLDYNSDGWPDLFVTNDVVRDFLYRSDGNGAFTELGTEAGLAFNDEGWATSSMSVDVNDYDHDGKLDVFVSTFESQSNLLFRNLGDDRFANVTHAAGLAGPSLPYVKWGANFIDYDSDGWTDIYIAHGHVSDTAEQITAGSTHAQPDQLYRNRGDGTFEIVSTDAGGWFAQARVGRGVAMGDIDNDGDTDIYVVANNGLGALVRNDTPTDNHWLRLDLVGTKSNRDAIGAQISVRAGDLVQLDEVTNGAGIYTGSDRRIVFGLGSHSAADEVTIRWPSGAETTLHDLDADQTHVITEK